MKRFLAASPLLLTMVGFTPVLALTEFTAM